MSMSRASDRSFWTMLGALGSFGALILIAGGVVVSRSWPVVADARFVIVWEDENEPGTVRILGHFNKVRDCRITGLSFQRGASPVEWRFEESYRPDPYTLVNRPGGENSVGPWWIKRPGNPRDWEEPLKITSSHKCLGLDGHTTVVFRMTPNESGGFRDHPRRALFVARGLAAIDRASLDPADREDAERLSLIHI